MSLPRTAVIEADLSNAEHQSEVMRLIEAYALDPMGDGRPLAEATRRDLIPGLRRHPTTHVFLAMRDNAAVGLAVCFRGFSTFAARPLINIHDFFVPAEHRGTGVGRLLLEAIERRAREMGCCKLTLEVQEKNFRAQGVYAAAGFARSEYVPEAGGALFLAKRL